MADTVVFPKMGRGYVPPPGTWRAATRNLQVVGVIVTCPDCGTVGTLGAQYSVDPTGHVNPSVRCDCGWHAFIELGGWVPPLPKRVDQQTGRILRPAPVVTRG